MKSCSGGGVNVQNQNIIILGLLTCLVGYKLAYAETKTDDVVFEKWVAWQKVFKDHSLPQMHKRLDRTFWGNFVKRYQKYQTRIDCYTPLMNSLCLGNVDSAIFLLSAKKTFKNFYSWIDKDIPQFLTYMQKNQFSTQAIDEQEQEIHIDDTIKKHTTLLKLFLNQPDKIKEQEYLFAFSNRMFEACFGDAAYNKKFYAMVNNNADHPLARFCYSTMWFYLVGEGWKHWHDACLKAVKRDADKGKEIVYIAGGNDIYQLLKYGIYNIRVIDPMLPSQPDYYAQGWDWLLQGQENHGIGDRLMLNFDDKPLVMKRESYQESDSFDAALSTGVTVKLPKSITTWGVYDTTEQKRVGEIIFDRRFCQQSDFNNDKKRSLLVSYNEMYFIAMPDSLHGWGIDMDALPRHLHWHVKQLRKPVTKEVLERLRKIEEDSNFSYIMLGSNAT